MKTHAITSAEFSHNLRNTLNHLGHDPHRYDLASLGAALRRAVPDSARKFPRDIINELGTTFDKCLPAYRRTNPTGLRLPIAGNYNHHIPEVTDDQELEQEFTFDAWFDTVAALGRWVEFNADTPSAGFRLAEALLDLLLAHTHIQVAGARTITSLAGQMGMDELADIITTYYGPDSPRYARWSPDLDDDYFDEYDDDNDEPRPVFGGHNFPGMAA